VKFQSQLKSASMSSSPAGPTLVLHRLYLAIFGAALLLVLCSAQNDNCYINDSGFTCCNKMLGWMVKVKE
jgi:hypothetical protein